MVKGKIATVIKDVGALVVTWMLGIGRQGTRTVAMRCDAELSKTRSVWDARQSYGFWGYRYRCCC